MLNSPQYRSAINPLYWFSRLFTARKRSLRRLCFHRCLSVHRGVSVSVQGGLHHGVEISLQGVSIQGRLWPGVSLSRGSLSGGFLSGRSLSGGSLSREGLCPGGSLSRGFCPGGLCLGGLCPGGICPGRSLSWRPPHTVMSRRNASYWNAFLFILNLILWHCYILLC